MRVAVTGARGFIGRRVVDSLLRLGIEVCVVERPRHHLASQPAPVGAAGLIPIRSCSLDLSDLTAPVHDVCGAPDVLLHLAWGMVQDVSSPLHLSRELPMHESFLLRAMLTGTPHVIAVGTCFEYGIEEGILTEETPTRPTTVYGEAKARLHDSVRNAAGDSDSMLTWLRPFYVYGPGQPTTTLWGQLNAAIERGDLEFPMSPGQQSRDYLHVDEMGRLIAEIAIRAPVAESVLNVCSGASSRVIDLVDDWIARSGSRIRPVLGAHPYSPFEPMHSVGSRRRLDAFLGHAA